MEDQLLALGRLIESANAARLRHHDQERIAEWIGADVVITSNFEPAESGLLNHDYMVRTQHAGVLSWLMFSLRDVFGEHLDAFNKYRFFGELGRAAIDHLASKQPESESPVLLLKAVLSCAFRFLGELREHDRILDGPSIVVHQTDSEGRQERK